MDANWNHILLDYIVDTCESCSFGSLEKCLRIVPVCLPTMFLCVNTLPVVPSSLVSIQLGRSDSTSEVMVFDNARVIAMGPAVVTTQCMLIHTGFVQLNNVTTWWHNTIVTMLLRHQFFWSCHSSTGLSINRHCHRILFTPNRSILRGRFFSLLPLDETRVTFFLLSFISIICWRIVSLHTSGPFNPFENTCALS